MDLYDLEEGLAERIESLKVWVQTWLLIGHIREC